MVEISFLKYFSSPTQYKTMEEYCLQVQEDLCKRLRGASFKYQLVIKPVSATIAFPVSLPQPYEFENYKNIFECMSKIYNQLNPGSQQIHYHSPLTKTTDCISLGKSPLIKIYNNRRRAQIEKYRYQGYRSNDIWFEASFDFLENQQSISSFENLELFAKYEPTIKSYILSNLFNEDILKRLQESEAEKLSRLLSTARDSKGFNYECFILSNIHLINDYKVIREALELTLGKGKTLEKAVTKVRKILKNIEGEREELIMDTYKNFINLKSAFGFLPT
jgi:hypothetical protein